MPNLPIIPPSLEEGFCPTTWQELINAGVGGAVAVFEGSGFTVVLNQESTPDATQHGFLWRKPSTGLIYNYESGAWVTPHPVAPGGDERRLYIGTLVALQTYDGGSVGAVGTASGPMWEEDTTFQGRSPMGPGAIANSNPAKTLAVAEQFGEGAHLQSGQEVGPHTHPLSADADITNSPAGTIKIVTSGTGGPGLARGETAPEVTPLSVQSNTYTTTQERGNVVHPVTGIYVIKRTARQMYRGA